MDANPDGPVIHEGPPLTFWGAGRLQADAVRCPVRIHDAIPGDQQAPSLLQHLRPSLPVGATLGLRPERVGGNLQVQDGTFTYTGSDVCVLLVEAGPVAPWAPGGDPDSTIRIVRCTFIGKFELRVADTRTRLVMEFCTVLENGTLNVHVANGAQVDLAQVHFGERSSGITVTGRGSRCNMHDCSIGLAEDATITVDQYARATLSKCRINGNRCITASNAAMLAVSRGTEVHALGDCAVSVTSRAVVDIATATLSANAASGTALALRGGAFATASASSFTAATGVLATSSSLKMLQSRASAVHYAVRARKAHVHIYDGCILDARGYAAVALEAGCNAIVTDSELHCSGYAALVAVAATVIAARNSLTLRGAAGSGCAGIVLNNPRSGSAIYGNTLEGRVEHAQLQFVHATRRDVAAVAVADGDILQHPRISKCDVLTERCTAHSTDDMHADREWWDAVMWLRELGARERRLGSNLSLAAAAAGHCAALPFEGIYMLLQWVWRSLAAAGAFAASHIIKPVSQAARAASGQLTAAANTEVNSSDAWCAALSLAIAVAVAGATYRTYGRGVPGSITLLLARLKPSDWSKQYDSK